MENCFPLKKKWSPTEKTSWKAGELIRPQGRALGERHSPEGRQPLIVSCWSQMPELKPSPDSYCLHDLWLDPTQPLLCTINTYNIVVKIIVLRHRRHLKDCLGHCHHLGSVSCCQIHPSPTVYFPVLLERGDWVASTPLNQKLCCDEHGFKLSLNMHLLLSSISSQSWARVSQRRIPRNWLLTWTLTLAHMRAFVSSLLCQ